LASRLRCGLTSPLNPPFFGEKKVEKRKRKEERRKGEEKKREGEGRSVQRCFGAGYALSQLPEKKGEGGGREKGGRKGGGRIERVSRALEALGRPPNLPLEKKKEKEEGEKREEEGPKACRHPSSSIREILAVAPAGRYRHPANLITSRKRKGKKKEKRGRGKGEEGGRGKKKTDQAADNRARYDRSAVSSLNGKGEKRKKRRGGGGKEKSGVVWQCGAS